MSESGTATGGGVDYTLRELNLTIAEGELSDTVSLSIIEDKLDEEDETILLTARSTSPALVSDQAVITIVDNDTPQVLVSPFDFDCQRRILDYVRRETRD